MALAMAAPLLVFAAVEGLLRLIGYGHPAGFLVRWRLDGRPVLVDNQFYTRRFFPGEMARTPETVVLDATKPTNALRVVVLGESAAAGEPAQEFGLPRQMQALLEAQFPERRIEVINAAVTAINSPVIRDIARDVKRCRPDAFVLYIGNNEVVGPFGPGFVLRPFTGARWYALTAVAVTRLRTGQALRDLYGRLRGYQERMRIWGGLEMFQHHEVHPDDPRLAAVYQNYDANLEDVLRIATAGGTPVVLSTVAVNLRDDPPFASLHRAGLSSADALASERHTERARAALKRGDAAEALAEADRALALDSGYAVAHFLRGRALESAGRKEEALASYHVARDRDAIRFRADSRINHVTADVAARWPARVRFLDAEALLQKATTNAAPGDDLFWDHVHLNFEGNYLLARAVVDALAPSLGARGGTSTQEALTQSQCAERLSFTPIENWKVLDKIVQRFGRPPFVLQIDHEARLERVKERQAAVNAVVEQSDRALWLAAYERAVLNHPGDWILLKLWAERLLGEGRIPEARRQAERALALVPHRADMRGELARLLAFEGNTDAALRVTRENPFHDRLAEDRIHYYIGGALLDGGQPSAAIPFFQAAAQHEVWGHTYRLHLAAALREAGRIDEAERVYLPIYDEANPDLDVLRGLALCHMARDRWAEAAALLERAVTGENPDPTDAWNLAMATQRKALQLQPGDARPHLQLGRLHLDRGLVKQAEAHFRAALLSPDTAAQAYEGLGQTLIAAGRWAEARQMLVDLGNMEASNPILLNDVAWQLATHVQPEMRDPVAAVRLATRSCELTGWTNPIPVDTLAAAAAASGDFQAAVERASMAAQLAENQGDTEMASRIMVRLEAFRRGELPMAGVNR